MPIPRLSFDGRRQLLVAVTMLFVAPLAFGQQTPSGGARPGAMSSDESAVLTRGWALLADGQAKEAQSTAVSALTRFPASHHVMALAVEADIAASGASTALARYEAWRGARMVEEPGALRAVARAMLLEIADEKQNPSGQAAALQALAEGGDATAAERLHAIAEEGNVAGTRALAALADPRAVTTLINDLNTGAGNKIGVIAALGASGSAVAMGPLVQQLGDPEDAVRGGAAEALGRLGANEAITPLRPLLQDRSGYVRAKAAGALLRLGDDSGTPFLHTLAAEAPATSRIVAAEELAARPDAAWLGLVRGLVGDSSPEIRLSAATLLAPHDPAAAKAVLEELQRNDNPAISEEAMRALAVDGPSDLTTLRGLLRSPDRLVRIAAAGKILAVTR